MDIKEYADSEMMMMSLASSLSGELMNILLTQDRASFAVPGGTTPGPIFDSLSASRLDWSRVDILPTDERWVPETDERSNARLIRQHLLTDKAAAANFISFYNGGADPSSGVAAVIERIEALYPISVVLLGMGDDMHVASLFPGADNLASALKEDAPAVIAMRGDIAPEPRITLSAGAINGAMSKHLVIVGDAKRKALERAQKLGDPLQAPVVAVLHGLTVHWAES